jgi:hypothetical protein
MEPEDVAADDSIARLLQPSSAGRHSFNLPRRSRSSRRPSTSFSSDQPHARVFPSFCCAGLLHPHLSSAFCDSDGVLSE